ncbi:hypothetical protein NEOLEDRAFT_622326 [Neolentinus lepideus HHB14362 ss-1]|uniref:Uncharacterized protein n=1 Tax=Neolentinus lepideus HHB14362 ss-1 TaxID=1314782 RepID=A0A165QT58_9AGAM|nr:hypothetical protein NEOLEDRAFT_622326 [Neolentinus lepideus HHB14362 ss-1]
MSTRIERRRWWRLCYILHHRPGNLRCMWGILRLVGHSCVLAGHGPPSTVNCHPSAPTSTASFASSTMVSSPMPRNSDLFCGRGATSSSDWHCYEIYLTWIIKPLTLKLLVPPEAVHEVPLSPCDMPARAVRTRLAALARELPEIPPCSAIPAHSDVPSQFPDAKPALHKQQTRGLFAGLAAEQLVQRSLAGWTTLTIVFRQTKGQTAR